MSLNLNRYKYKIIASLVILLCLITGCEEIVDFPTGNQEYSKTPVVEGFLTNRQEEQWVRVTNTLPLSDSLSCEVVSDANVLIYSNSGDTAHFKYHKDGWYISSPFAAEEGKQYTLEVKIGNFVAKSFSDYIPVRQIDSLYYKHYRQSDKKDSVYHVFMNAGVSVPQKTRYYMLEVFKNGKEVTLGDEIWIFNDKNTLTLSNIEVPVESRMGDTIDVEIHTLTELMYSYFSRFTEVIISNAIVNQNYRENPPLMFDQKVMGYFKVSGVHSKRIIIGKK